MKLLHKYMIAAGRNALLAATFVFPFVAAAKSVEVEPGGLQAAVGEDASTETSLTVTGSLNVSDFDFLREMTALQSLDLSGATVAAYQGEATATGQTASGANVLPYCALMSGNFTTLKLPAGITEIADGALGGCRAATVEIPSTVTTIAVGAFSSMPNLESVIIPAGVTTFGERMFKDCPKLKTVVFQGTLAELPAATFYNCKSLESVQLPALLTTIGENAFEGCGSLKELNFPATLTVVGDGAFMGSGLEAPDLSGCAGLKELGDWAFADCAGLQEITLPSSVTSLGKGVFFKSTLGGDIAGIVPESATKLPDFSFYGSGVDPSNLGELPLDSIGAYAMSGLSAEKMQLPATLKSLDGNAMERTHFDELDVVNDVDIPELGESVWSEVDQANTVLRVPDKLFDRYSQLPQWKEFNVQKNGDSLAGNIYDDGLAVSRLRAAFDGELLRLHADTGLRAAQLYDVSGRCFTIVQTTASQSLTIDTAPYATSVFIVRVLLSDDTVEILKVARK